MCADKKIEKWTRWLEIIFYEVSNLVRSRNIYYEIRQIVTDNPRINTGNRFYEWIETNYVNTTLMGIRRQIDNHCDAISLKKLLNDMKDNCNLLSRERHLIHYKDKEMMKRIGNSTFDNLAGKTINIFPIENIEQDLKQLEQIKELHGTYIDKRIAHYDKVRQINKVLGTFQDLDDAVSSFEQILSRYYLLIMATSIELLPVPEYDWKIIFRQAWISDTSQLDKIDVPHTHGDETI